MGDHARARQRLIIPGLRVRFISEGIEAVGRISEVSRAGLFIESDEFPRPGAVIAVQFHTESGELVDLRGEVRWTTQGAAHGSETEGFGMLVHEAPLAYRDFFVQTLDDPEKDDGEEL